MLYKLILTFSWIHCDFLQVLTQEDWNLVLFLGMERTSHWAALYFVALMTFGNYVLFNLLVAILVEGFSNQVGNTNILITCGKSDKQFGNQIMLKQNKW